MRIQRGLPKILGLILLCILCVGTPGRPLVSSSLCIAAGENQPLAVTVQVRSGYYWGEQPSEVTLSVLFAEVSLRLSSAKDSKKTS